MTTREVTVKPYDNGLLRYTDTGETVGYLYLHTGRGGAYTLPLRAGRAYDPTGYVGELTAEVVKRHNEALEARDIAYIVEGLPDRVSVYWSTALPIGEPNYWGGGWSRVLPNMAVTLWTGKKIGYVIFRGQKTTTLGGARRQWIRVSIGSAVYGGYATSTRDLVHLKKLRRAY